MGKRRVQTKQVRRQVRQVKPKNIAPPATAGEQKRQRERYVQSGGLLQGYAPEFVERVTYYSAAVAACIVIGHLFLLLLPYGWPVRVVAALAWLVPVAFLASFILPGWNLARKDKRAEPKLVQGQLMGASSMSTSLGLGMLMVQTRGGMDQYLVAPEKLTKVPGNQVPVVLTVTPNLRHVKSVGVMGQRMVGRPEPPVPDVVRRLRLLPLATPIALSAAVIIGTEVVALIPIQPDLLHAAIALIVGAALGVGVYFLSTLVQRRMYAQVQALMPGVG